MSEQINSIINNLSEKLGVAVDKIYPMLIKQAYIEGIISIIAILFGIFLCIAPIFIYKLVVKEDKNGNYIAKYWDDWFWFITMIGVVEIVGFLLIILNVSNAITAFGNPEWYALRSILQQIKQ